jgi:hypothetical protein
MATVHAAITPEQAALIARAPVFFVASAEPALADGPHGVGPVNLSPKGGPLLIVSPSRVAYLDSPGSGNETARHAQAGGAMTLMVCSFEAGDAAIVRLYGRASVQPFAGSPYGEALLAAGEGAPPRVIRQVIVLDVERTVTSCGYGVPVMEFVRQRAKADRGRRYKEGEN